MKHVIEFARDLRRRQTPHEQKLWRYLRAGRLDQFKFRRQQPVGSFIVDFVCFEKKLVIELDGSQHLDSQRDKIRDRLFAEAGFRVLRFWNADIDRNLEGVLAVIDEKLRNA